MSEIRFETTHPLQHNACKFGSRVSFLVLPGCLAMGKLPKLLNLNIFWKRQYLIPEFLLALNEMM